jgi:hypothetical protein
MPKHAGWRRAQLCGWSFYNSDEDLALASLC